MAGGVEDDLAALEVAAGELPDGIRRGPRRPEPELDDDLAEDYRIAEQAARQSDTDEPPRPTTRPGVLSSVTASDFFRVARRPRWIGVLVLALGARRRRSRRSASGSSPAASRTRGRRERGGLGGAGAPSRRSPRPQTPMNDLQVGRMVTVDARPRRRATSRCSPNARTTAVFGAWLVGHAVTDEGASLAVALGWAPDAAAAAAAAADGRSPEPDRAGPLPGERVAARIRLRGGRAQRALGRRAHQPLGRGPRDHLRRLPGARARRRPGSSRSTRPRRRARSSLNWLNLFYAARVGDLRRVRDLPLVPPGAGRVGARRGGAQRAAGRP